MLVIDVWVCLHPWDDGALHILEIWIEIAVDTNPHGQVEYASEVLPDMPVGIESVVLRRDLDLDHLNKYTELEEADQRDDWSMLLPHAVVVAVADAAAAAVVAVAAELVPEMKEDESTVDPLRAL